MAKVKIQGHASGTGILTVTAPNTSTDRTITLPDATDTLIGAATTDALTTRINANGGRKNLIINGAMNVYQRSAANISDSVAIFSLDRWYCYFNGGALGAITQDTDVPAGQGFGFSHKIDITTGDALGTSTDITRLSYDIEAQDLQHLEYGHANAKTMTLSFWIKSTITGTYIAAFYQGDSAGDRILSKSYTVDSADTWEKKTITIEGDASGTINNDNGAGMMLNFGLGAGSNWTSGTLATSWQNYDATDQFTGQVNAVSSASNNIYITGVQLEVGTAATDFEHRSFGEELALCQRYYEAGSYWYEGASNNNSWQVHTVPMKVKKRTNATITSTQASTDAGIGSDSGAESAYNPNDQGQDDRTAEFNYRWMPNSSQCTYRKTWTADAEL